MTRVLPMFSNAVRRIDRPSRLRTGGSILAQPFDYERRSVTGEPTVLASGVASIEGYTHFAPARAHAPLRASGRRGGARARLVRRAGNPVGKGSVRLQSDFHVAGRATRCHRAGPLMRR